MKELCTGFAFLQRKEYSQAYDYFYQRSIEYQADPMLLDTCLYGQARALIGLGNIEFAKAILFAIINGGSCWERAFVLLARIYENEGKTFLAQGNHEQALAKFQKAYDVFLLGFEKINYAGYLYDNYLYFQQHYFPQAKSFTPSFHDAKSLTLLPAFLQEQVTNSRLPRRSIS